MPEEVIFESEQRQSLSAVASYLRTVADKLDAGEAIRLEHGGESVELTPPAEVEFEVKAEREGPAGDMTELSLELELEWDTAAGDSGSLSIE
jgi:amphi-Trp domain-containing protein